MRKFKRIRATVGWHTQAKKKQNDRNVLTEHSGYGCCILMASRIMAEVQDLFFFYIFISTIRINYPLCDCAMSEADRIHPVHLILLEASLQSTINSVYGEIICMLGVLVWMVLEWWLPHQRNNVFHACHHSHMMSHYTFTTVAGCWMSAWQKCVCPWTTYVLACICDNSYGIHIANACKKFSFIFFLVFPNITDNLILILRLHAVHLIL